ncbi:MAG: alpha/beta hydrolase [Actinomycetota bacterium]
MPKRQLSRSLAAFLSLAVLLIALPPAEAGPLRDRIAQLRNQQGHDDSLDEDGAATAAPLPPGTRVWRDVAYGSDPNQRFDVYAPAKAKVAPVILMVHGGGWARGDKAARGVAPNKVARWIPKGFMVISANYRMLPAADPLTQARDVARALAAAQERAAEWGGDASRFILMGHSAGAHLVAMLTSSPALASEAGAKPWLGAVYLDSAALDLVSLMEGRHFGLYDRAFGADKEYWRANSPYHLLTRAAPPVLAVCSTRRAEACPHARAYTAKARSLGMSASVLEEDLTHGQINGELGLESPYTAAVESFFDSILKPRPAR